MVYNLFCLQPRNLSQNTVFGNLNHMPLRYKAKNSDEYSLIHKMCSYKTSAKCGVSLNNNVCNVNLRDLTLNAKLLPPFGILSVDDNSR